MEYHINGEPKDISRYVFCPGSQSRAGKIADHFENRVTVSNDRGIVVYSGTYEGHFMTACGTGMGGAAVGIACEELGHLGADTFIRVGSCGALQDDQQVGDVVIANGTYRAGGTGLAYMPLNFPAVATFSVTRALADAAAELGVPVRVGVGAAGDSFYGPLGAEAIGLVASAGGLFIEMESDTLFVIGAVRGWRTGALFTADGTTTATKPASALDAFRRGEADSIRFALRAMVAIAEADKRASA